MAQCFKFNNGSLTQAFLDKKTTTKNKTKWKTTITNGNQKPNLPKPRDFLVIVAIGQVVDGEHNNTITKNHPTLTLHEY